MLLRNVLPVAVSALFMIAAPVEAQDGEVAPDTVIATVNGTEITLGHMLVIRARLPQQYEDLDPKVLFDGILDQLVQQTLLSQTASDLTMTNRLILENEDRALRASQIIANAARESTSEEAIQAEYEAEFANEPGEMEFNASHILVETEDEAKSIITELEGGADFAELAKEKSTGPSGPNGGLLGWFGPGMMVAPFEEAVLALEPGEISPPVQTQFGWHVVTLNDRRQTEAPTIDDVRDQLVETIQRRAVEELVEELKAAGEVALPDPDAFDPTIINNVTLLGE